MHQLTSEEIDSLCAAGNYKTLDLSLFSVCIGVLVTMWVVLATVPVESMTPNMVASFTGALYISIIGTIFFGIRAILGWIKASKAVKTIKGET